jgi:hypothetical protein
MLVHGPQQASLSPQQASHLSLPLPQLMSQLQLSTHCTDCAATNFTTPHTANSITKRDVHKYVIFVAAREQPFQMLNRQIWNHGQRRMLRDMAAWTLGQWLLRSASGCCVSRSTPR